MSDTPIAQHLDAFRSLARHHLEHGSIEGLAALKQTLEMDNKAFADLLKPLLVAETPTVEPQKQPLPSIDDNLIKEVIDAMPKPERKPFVRPIKPKNNRYVVRLTVSPTNFLGFVLQDVDTRENDYEGTFAQMWANDLKPGDIIALNRIPRYGLDNLDYTKVGFDEDVASEYPYLEDQPVGYNHATGGFYVNIPAQNRTKAFRYYLSNEIVDKLDRRLGYADFKEGCLVTGFVISEKHFHITYVEARPFNSALQSSK